MGDGDRLQDLDTWRDIVTSEGWVLFKELLEVHQEFLTKQVVICVGQREFDNAVRYEAKLEECKKIISLVEGRLKELKSPKEKE